MLRKIYDLGACNFDLDMDTAKELLAQAADNGPEQLWGAELALLAEAALRVSAAVAPALQREEEGALPPCTAEMVLSA